MLSVIMMPLLRRRGEPALTRELAAGVGRRFGTLTVAGLLPLLVITGLALAWHHHMTLAALGHTTYGMVLGAKMVLVVAVFVLAALHGLAARRLTPQAGRRIALVTLLLSLGIVALAAVLAELPG